MGRLTSSFSTMAFKRTNKIIVSTFTRYSHSYFFLYIDDLVLTSPSPEDIVWIQTLLHQQFEMTDLGPLTCFLGMEIQRYHPGRTLYLSQRKYMESILTKHGKSESAPVSTPADPHSHLQISLPEHQADSINQQRYQSAVGSLMYAMIGSRRDIAFAVSAVSQHCSNPGAAH